VSDYKVFHRFSMVELEDEIESLFAWVSYMSGVGYGYFGIGQVKEHHE